MGTQESGEWINVARHAFRPSYLPVMMGKVRSRLEPDTRAEATAWARQRAVNVASYCEELDAKTWRDVTISCAAMVDDGRRRLAELDVRLGGGGAHPLLSFLVRTKRPEVVLETGVAAGWSSRAILEALEANGQGRLHSSDFPYFRLNSPERFIGCVVPDDLRSHWILDTRGDRKALPHFLASVDRVDLFHYDSDKSSNGRAFAMSLVWDRLAEDGVVLMDDIQDNVFFRDWVEQRELAHRVFEFEGKYIGAIGI
jgi:hypothetical protein